MFDPFLSLNNSPRKKKNIEEFGKLIDMKNKNLVDEKLRKYSLISNDSTNSKSNQRSQDFTPIKFKISNKNLLDFKNTDIPQSNLFYIDNLRFKESKSLEEEYKNNNLNLLEDEKEFLLGIRTPEKRSNEKKSGIILTTDYFADENNSSDKTKKIGSIFKKYNSKIKSRLNFNNIRSPAENKKDQNFTYFDNFNTTINNTEAIFTDNLKKAISPIKSHISTMNKGDNLFNNYDYSNYNTNNSEVTNYDNSKNAFAVNFNFDNSNRDNLSEKIEKKDKIISWEIEKNSNNRNKKNYNDLSFHLKDKVNINDEIKNSFFENIHEKLKLMQEDNKISGEVNFSKKYSVNQSNLINNDLFTNNGCKEFQNTSASIISNKSK
jgi:hypothetical protein